MTVTQRRLAGRRPERRSQEKYAAILDAAAAMVSARGYRAATVEAVAARAGVGKQTIYRWWPNKAALYVEVYAALVPAARLQVEAGDLTAEPRHCLRQLFQIYREGPAASILVGLIADAQDEPAAAEAIRQGLIVGRRALLLEPLRRGIARGELFADFDCERACDLIVALIWYRLLSGQNGPDDDFVETLIDMALRSSG